MKEALLYIGEELYTLGSRTCFEKVVDEYIVSKLWKRPIFKVINSVPIALYDLLYRAPCTPPPLYDLF